MSEQVNAMASFEISEMPMKEDFEISCMFEAAVAEALEAGWSEDRIREEFEAAMASAVEPE